MVAEKKPKKNGIAKTVQLLFFLFGKKKLKKRIRETAHNSHG